MTLLPLELHVYGLWHGVILKFTYIYMWARMMACGGTTGSGREQQQKNGHHKVQTSILLRTTLAKREMEGKNRHWMGANGVFCFSSLSLSFSQMREIWLIVLMLIATKHRMDETHIDSHIISSSIWAFIPWDIGNRLDSHSKYQLFKLLNYNSTLT